VDLLTLLLLVAIIWIGLWVPNMWFISVIGGILLFTYAWGTRMDKRPPAPAGGLKVRPIVVQRKYVGPESIYPRYMQMRVNPKWDTRKWFEQASGAFGLIAGWASNAGQPSKRPK